jgi:hypothetical protein
VDTLEFFNGRLAPYLGLVHIAKELGIRFNVIEVTGSDGHLTMFHNTTPHSIDSSKQRINEYVARAKKETKADSSFFHLKRQGHHTDAKSFTSNQKHGLIRLPKDKKYLVIYTSSDDEMLVTGDEWLTAASKNQLDFIIKLAHSVHSDYHVVVRMHPNQSGDKTGRMNMFMKAAMGIPVITLIKPLDAASSYELLDMASVVLTFGSTIGLEATFWEKPSILCGRSIWEDLDIAYKAYTVDSVVSLLSNHPLEPKSKEDACYIGMYLMEGSGIPSPLSKSAKYPGFCVNKHSFLPQKRQSKSYWLSRIIDNSLRI